MISSTHSGAFSDPQCRFCNASLRHTFADLGSTPISNAFLDAKVNNLSELIFPLHAFVCEHCKLVQLGSDLPAMAHFKSDYVYFSSFSTIWLDHVESYTHMMIDHQALSSRSFVVELGSNDGCLLHCFLKRGIPVLGIDPSANVAQVAERERGVKTLVHFFGSETAKMVKDEFGAADLIVANNVLAHVPDIVDFVRGCKTLLQSSGVITFEFPHLLRLIEGVQFDTIYHEHYTYLSLLAVEKILLECGLRAFDVHSLPTHGGSLRLFVGHATSKQQSTAALLNLRHEERTAGIHEMAKYEAFSERVRRTKRQLLSFMIEQKDAGKSIVGYGAPAKGNTLLNYCGIRSDFLDYTVDKNPIKQGRMLPGSRIRVEAPEMIFKTRPDYVLILPWNIKTEIVNEMAKVRKWGGQFVVPIPEVTILS